MLEHHRLLRLARYITRVFIFPFWLLDAQKKYAWIAAHLRPEDEILELGSGMGSVIQILRDRGHRVAAFDVRDTSVRDDLSPALYDGMRLPIRDRDCDICLLSTVLHHCANPDQVLAEALRTAKKVIIIEDVYDTPWQRRLTHWLDSLLNWEFHTHPHSNRSDAEWKASFNRHGAALIDTHIYKVALLFRQAVYVIIPRSNGDNV